MRAESVRDFTAAQTLGGVAADLREHYLPLRFPFGQRRKHGAKDFANRREIVAGNPLRQLNQLRSQRRSEIEHFGDFAEFRVLRNSVRKLHDYADKRFLAKRNQHAASWLRGI